MKDITIDYSRERLFPGFDKKYHKVAPTIILGKENNAYMFYGMNYLGGSDVLCGARLGNFDVTDVSENEAWVTVAEWMQNDPLGWEVCAKYGSDNAIWISRIIKK